MTLFEARPAIYPTTGIREISADKGIQLDGNIDIFAPQALLNSLAIIRSESATQEEFIRHSDYIFHLLGSRIAEEIPTIETEVVTPLDRISTNLSDGSNVLIVAILRSGYPASTGIRTAIPGAKIGVVDIKRDEDTSEPEMNYDGLEGFDLSRYERIIIPDPMLATGGSASMAIDMLRERDARKIHLVSLVAAPEGIERMQRDYPDVRITTAAVDSHLNNKNFIVPGLGDFGDRYYEDSPLIIYDELNSDRPLRYQKGRLDVSESRKGGGAF